MNKKGKLSKRLCLLLLSAICAVASAFFAACAPETPPEDDDSTSAPTYTVTFMQEGEKDIVRTVKEGESLTDIPAPVPEKGYTIAWDKTDFSSVTENITVTAVKTANVYTITYNLGVNNYATLSEKTQSATYGQAYTLLTPQYNGAAKFLGWYVAGENGKATDEKAQDGKYLWAEDIILVAAWEEWSDVVN